MTITGVSMPTDTTVTIGGHACTSVVVAEDGASLTCTVPAGVEGTNVPVLVNVGVGDPKTIPGGYTYETPAAILPPNKPRGTSVKGGPTAPTYKVTWKKPVNKSGSRPVTGYRLLVNQKGFSKLILAKSLKSSKTSYTLKRSFLKRNAMKPRGDMAGLLRFRVRVVALNSAGTGPISTAYLWLRL
ncbi:MAG: IPT/TIG domain-containing protein [Candidatus Nanopelagicales bacterium]